MKHAPKTSAAFQERKKKKKKKTAKAKMSKIFTTLQQSTQTRARAGLLHTPHGNVTTPGFVPVATCAALKGPLLNTLPDDTLCFANALHLAVSGSIPQFGVTRGKRPIRPPHPLFNLPFPHFAFPILILC
jgi:hypothetical protein